MKKATIQGIAAASFSILALLVLVEGPGFSTTRTLVDADSTQTLTNKTLSSPTITGTVNPASTLGDMLYAGESAAISRLAGNTTATLRTLTQIGTGSVSAAPQWMNTLSAQGGLHNVGLTATVGSNALTITLTGADGNAPSTTNPVSVAFFNDSTATSGVPVIRTVTSSSTVVVSNGSTLGTTNSTTYRLWVVAIDNGTTFDVGIYNSQAASSIIGLSEHIAYSSTAEGGAGGADSAQVLYSTTARTSKQVRHIGFVEISQATAGAWASAPNKTVPVGPGVPMSGSIIKHVSATVSVASNSSSSTYADTGLTASITPSSTVNRIKVTVFQTGLYKNFSDTEVGLKLLRGASLVAQLEGNAADNAGITSNSVGGTGGVFVDSPASISSVTYKTQFASTSNSATVSVQNVNETSSILLEEIFP